jgi:hypothetical protein
LAGAEAAQGELRRAGIECRARDDELSLLWDKVAFLAPIVLATSALGAPLELDAIAGSILRGGHQHGLASESTQQLADQVRTRSRP